MCLCCSWLPRRSSTFASGWTSSSTFDTGRQARGGGHVKRDIAPGQLSSFLKCLDVILVSARAFLSFSLIAPNFPSGRLLCGAQLLGLSHGSHR